MLTATWMSAQVSLQHDQVFNSNDFGFGYGDGFNYPTKCAAELTEGRILIGGNFDRYHGNEVSRLVCLNENLEVASDFQEPYGVNGTVQCITQLASGQIMIGGGFTEFMGQSALRVFRLNSDGSSDQQFNSYTGANGMVHSILELMDGRMLVTGDFSNYQGNAVNRVATVLPNGALDLGFSVGSGPDGLVYKATEQSDGSIVLVGAFQAFNGIPCNGVVKILPSGAFDPSFSVDLPTSVTFRTVTTLEDHTLLIGGAYHDSDTNGVLINIDQNGQEVQVFYQHPEISGAVFHASQDSDGKILVVGDFTEWEGQSCAGVIRLSSNGEVDLSFGITPSYQGEIQQGIPMANGQVLLVGILTSFGGQPTNHLVTLNDSGAIVNQGVIGTGCNKPVLGSLALSQNAFLVFGEMELYNGQSVGHVFKVDEFGTLDTGFDCGICANDHVTSAVKLADGGLLIGGAFSCFNGTLRKGLVKITQNGEVDQQFDVGSGADGKVYAIHVLPNGNIAVAGNFQRFNGYQSPGLVVISQSGEIVTSFNVGSGFDGPVLSLSSIKNNLVVGGQFSRYQGQSCENITLLNGQGNVESSWQSVEISGPVYSVASINGKILVGGRFLQVNGTDQQYLAALNGNGELTQGFSSGSWPNNAVFSILPFSDGQQILVGGDFTEYHGQQALYIALINNNGVLIPGIQTDCEPNGPVNSLIMCEDHSVLVGGVFTAIADTGRNRLAKLSSTLTSQPTDSTLMNLTLSPNPTQDDLRIEGIYDELEVSVFNLLGELVIGRSTLKPFDRISVGDLESSTYFVKLKKHQTSIMKKLIKVE